MFLKLRASEMKISAYVVGIGFAIISLCQITYSTDDLDDLDSDNNVDIIRTPRSAHNTGNEYHAVITFQNENRSGNDVNEVIEGDSIKFHCTYNPSNSSLELGSTYNFAHTDLKTFQNKYVQQGKEPVFSLKSVTLEDTGSYKCEVHGPLGILHSGPLIVEVKPKYPGQGNVTAESIRLVAELQPSSQSHYYEGDRLYIYCDIQPDTTKYRSIQWFHNGFEFKEWYPVQSMRHFGKIIEIRDLKKSNLGNYTCGIETFENITYRSFPDQLSKIKEDKYRNYSCDTGTPFTTVKLDDEMMLLSEIYEGMNVWLSCDVKPTQTFIFSVQWYHNGSSFLEYWSPDSKFYYGTLRQTIFLQNVTLYNSGIYECVMDTKNGDVKPSKEPQFILQVKPKPT